MYRGLGSISAAFVGPVHDLPTGLDPRPSPRDLRSSVFSGARRESELAIPPKPEKSRLLRAPALQAPAGAGRKRPCEDLCLHPAQEFLNSAAASVATRTAVTAGSERSDTIGDSVQADAARGAQAIVKVLGSVGGDATYRDVLR